LLRVLRRRVDETLGWVGLGIEYGWCRARIDLVRRQHATNTTRSRPQPFGPLGMLSLQLSLPHFLPLSQGNIQRLGADHSSVHLSNCSGGLFRTGEADKTKAFASTLLIPHYLG
jgi:hypothetical protein